MHLLQDILEPDAKITRYDTGTEDSLDALPAPQTNHNLRTATAGNSCFAMSKKYKYLVYFGGLAEGELVAVEVSPLALEKHLPPALYKKRFGV